jgi:FAD/FMN-containing dehydrogenase
VIGSLTAGKLRNLVNGDLLDRSHIRARRVGLIVISWKSEIMQNVATDLAQLLGLERVLWEREHLVTYGFDGTATLYGEAGCVVLPQTTEEVTQVVRYAFLPKAIGDASLGLMRRFKRTLDPDNLLNPGKIFD